MSSVFSRYTLEITKLQSPKRLFLEILNLGFVGVALVATTQSAYANNSQLSCKNSIAGFSKSEEFKKSESAKELGEILDSAKIAKAQKTEVLQINQNMNSEIASLGFSHEQILWVNSMIANLFEAYGMREHKYLEGQSSILKYKYIESRDKIVARSLELLPEERKVDLAKLSDVRKKLQRFIDEKMNLYNYVFIHSQEKKKIDRSKESKREAKEKKNVVILDFYVAREPTKEELALVGRQKEIPFDILDEKDISFNNFKYRLSQTHKKGKVTSVFPLSIDQFVSVHLSKNKPTLGYWTQEPSGRLNLVEAEDESLHAGTHFYRVSENQLLSSFGKNDLVLWTFNSDKTIDKLVLGSPVGWVSELQVLSATRFVTKSQAGKTRLWEILPGRKVTSKWLYEDEIVKANVNKILVLSESTFLVSGEWFIDYWDLGKRVGKRVTRLTSVEVPGILQHIKVAQSKAVSYSSEMILYNVFDEKGKAKSVVARPPEGTGFYKVYLLGEDKLVAFLSNGKMRSYSLSDMASYEEYDVGETSSMHGTDLYPLSESKFATISRFSDLELWSLEPKGVFTRKTIEIPSVYKNWSLIGLVKKDGSYLTEWSVPVLYSGWHHKILVPERLSLFEEKERSHE